MNKLLIATTNPAKFAEYRKLLANSGMELVSLTDVGFSEIPQETGKTFEENAIIKAKFYSQKCGLPALADDGGLEIEAIGQSGIHTPNLPDEEIINDIINRMKNVPEDQRKCKLSVAIALSTPYGIMTSFSDVVGTIPLKPSEKRLAGYPFRSLIFLPSYNKYYIDITDEEDEVLNHRRHALEKIQDMVQELSNR